MKQYFFALLLASFLVGCESESLPPAPGPSPEQVEATEAARRAAEQEARQKEEQIRAAELARGRAFAKCISEDVEITCTQAELVTQHKTCYARIYGSN